MNGITDFSQSSLCHSSSSFKSSSLLLHVLVVVLIFFIKSLIELDIIHQFKLYESVFLVVHKDV